MREQKHCLLEVLTAADRVRRLPANLTSTFIFFISSTIPSAFLNESLLSKKIVTAGRRRMIFNLSPGKDLILIREEFSEYAVGNRANLRFSLLS
jgi:hypothetical protein